MPNLKNLYPQATKLAFDPGNTYAIPYAWGTTGLCYRSDLVEGTPDSWSYLLNPPEALKGKITMLSTDRWLMGAGLLYKGYSVNEKDPAKIEEAKNALIEAKKGLLAYDDTTFFSKLVSGEASLVQAWDGWCNYGIAENDKIKFVVPKEGSDLWIDTMVVMKNSEHKEAAMKFLDFILEAKNHASGRVEHLLRSAQQTGHGKPRSGAHQEIPDHGASRRKHWSSMRSCRIWARHSATIRVR